MKDRQPDLVAQPGYIPVIGQLLHWIAMPAALCLRSSFGYLFLRPRSIFLSFSLAFTLLFIVAWNEPALWRNYAPACSFAFAVSCLYVLNLLAAFGKQVAETAGHDLYSGRSHVLRIARGLGIPYSASLEISIKLWIEPAIVLFAAGAARVIGRDAILANWLTAIAVCLWANEFRVYWYHLRRKKRQADLMADTKDEAEDHQDKPDVAPPKATKRPKQKHDRLGD
jgi:hypothetical protein